MRSLIAIILITLPMVVSCAKLPGFGPNVAANVPVGKEVRQAVADNSKTAKVTVQREASVGKVVQETGQTEVRTEKVETIVIRNEVPPWLWIMWATTVIIAILMDSPTTILANLFRRNRE